MRCIASLTCLFACAPALAGQLAPPAGPVSSTMKTLVEVEPRTAITQDNTPGDAAAVFVISSPGSYYLTDNLLGVAGKDGIRVQAAGVTIDLNGFACLGVAAAFDAVHVNLGNNEISISNGTIISWGGDGIDADGSSSSKLRNLVIVNNGGAGALLNNNYLVENIIAQNNGGHGLDLSSVGTVRNAECSFNGANGIVTLGQGQVIECVATGNGISGIGCNNLAIVISCFTKSNLLEGITVGQFSKVLNSSALSNRNGIIIGDDSTVRNCIAHSNSDHGITLRNRCRASNNEANLNGIISAGSFCGIIVGGNDGLIEGNSVMGNDNGICTGGGSSGCTIVRNVARANTFSNYSIGLGHFAGGIVANPAAAGPWDNLSN